MSCYRFVRSFGFGLLALALVAGCGEKKGSPAGGKSAKSQPEKAAAAAPAKDHMAAPAKPHAAASAKAGPGPAGGKTVNGQVLETMDAGGYTYMRVKTPEGEVWAAGPLTPLKVGDTVATPPGGAMRNFESRTLSRKFELIYFVPQIAVGAAGAAPKMPASAPTRPAAAPAAKAPAAPKLDGIAKVEGGLTVAEIFAKKAALSGKSVKVRGRVVKSNAGIMGRNWLHVQDGTGAAGSTDLTVTTDVKAPAAAVGDLVVIEGTVGLDRDFGPNYKYGVIVEKAKVTKQK